MKGPRPIWRYESLTSVFGVLTSPAQKHFMTAGLVSGGGFVNSVLATGQTCSNSPCQKLALPFLSSTMDILVPETSIFHQSPWSCALWPLGGEKLRERLQILTWSEWAQHRWQKAREWLVVPHVSVMVSWQLCCCSYTNAHHLPPRGESSWGFWPGMPLKHMKV